MHRAASQRTPHVELLRATCTPVDWDDTDLRKPEHTMIGAVCQIWKEVGACGRVTCQEQAVLCALLPEAIAELACAILQEEHLVYDEVVPYKLAELRGATRAHHYLLARQQQMCRACRTSHMGANGLWLRAC